MEKVIISTNKKFELVNITEQISKAVENSKAKSGLCLIYAPHASGAILINEDDPGFRADIEKIISKWIPESDWEHNKVDNNATAHLGSALIGQERSIPIENGKLALGTWQEIFFVELDGPRQSRQVLVQFVGN